jgi:hypothetical protein
MSDLNTKTVAELDIMIAQEAKDLGQRYRSDKAEIDRAHKEAMAKLNAWFDVAVETIDDKYRDALNEADLRDCPKCHGTRVWTVERPERGEDEAIPCPERTYDGESTHGQAVIDGKIDAVVEKWLDRVNARDAQRMVEP